MFDFDQTNVKVTGFKECPIHSPLADKIMGIAIDNLPNGTCIVDLDTKKYPKRCSCNWTEEDFEKSYKENIEIYKKHLRDRNAISEITDKLWSC